MDNWYGIGLDTDQLLRDSDKAKAILNSIGNSAEIQGQRLDSQFANIGKSIAGYLSVAAVAGFVKEVANVRGEFQDLETGFTTMLGSKAKSTELMNQMVNTAAKTPFTLQEVAGGAKQLLAYQVAQEDVNDTLIRLGNISSGLSVPISRLIMVYGQVKAKGKLMGDDLRQFTEAGVPMIHELAKQMGVADGEVQKLISSGKVGFPEVQKVIENLTASGGMFYNLMEEKSKNINGQISNLGDTISRSFNAIGQSNEGVISDAILGATFIVEHYEQVGKVIAGLIAVYGTYKAAVMTINAINLIQKEIAYQQVLANIANAGSTITLSTTEGIAAVVKSKLTAAQLALNKAMLSNPYVLVAMAIAGVAVAMWALHDSTTAAEKAQLAYNEEKKLAAEAEEKHRGEIEKLISAATNQALADMERIGALESLKKKYPEIFAKYDIENLKLADILKLKKQISEADSVKSVQGNKDKVSGIDKQIQDAQNKITGLKNSDRVTEGTAHSIVSLEKFIVELQSKKRLYQQDVEKDSVASWTSSISKMTDAQVKAEIAKRNKILSAIKESGKSDSVGKVGSLGYFNADEIKSQNSSLEAALNSRNVIVVKNAAFWEDQKKKATDSQKAMGDDMLGSKDWKAQQQLIDEADKHLSARSTKSITKNKKDADKRAQGIADAALRETNLIAKSGLDKLQKELDNQKALDNLLEDGFAKKKALIDDDHKQELLNIEKQAQDMLEKQQEAEKLAWEKGGKKGVFKPTSNTVSDLSAENKGVLKTSSTVVEIIYKSNSDKLVKELKDKYASFDEKRREIDKQYWQDEVSIKSMFSGDALNVRLDELNRQHKDAIEANDKEEADSVLKNTELFIQLFGDMSDKSVSDIRKIANESEALFDYLKTTSVNNITPKFGLSADQLISLKLGKSEMKSIEDQIKSINSNADSLETGFSKIGSGISKLFEGSKQKTAGKAKVKSGQNKIDSGIPELVSEGKTEVSIGNKDQLDGLAKEKAGIDALQESFQTVSFFAGQAQGLLNAMSTEEGDAASSAAKSIGAVMDVANSTMEGFKQGGVIGAGVAFAVSVATKIFESEKAHQAALKKLRDEKIAQQKEYNDLLMKQNELLEKATNIFGTDAYSQAIGYAQVADKLREALYSKDSTVTQKQGTGVFANLMPEVREYKGAIAALNNAKVQTGSHKTGLFGWGGEKADYSSLLKTYPALIDGQGKLNKELAQSVLDNQTLDETSKKALQSALDYTKDYEDALKSLSDYLTSVFGSLGQDMMTAITDNLGDTQSALDKFADNSAKTIEKLMTDIAYSMFLADKFTKLSDDVKAIITDKSLSPQDQAAKETALLGDFYSNVGDDVEAANKFLQNSKDAASKAGFDLWNETTREATTKGFASMNQDSADEMNGRFTVIQGHTFKITEGMDILKANSTQALKHLAGIETNTARLEAVESGINAVKLGIDTINMKGVKLQ